MIYLRQIIVKGGCVVDASRIAAYQARRKAEKASARTLNKELQVLRQVLKRHKLWANLQGDVKFEREHNDVGKALSREGEMKLLVALMLYSTQL